MNNYSLIYNLINVQTKSLNNLVLSCISLFPFACTNMKQRSAIVGKLKRFSSHVREAYFAELTEIKWYKVFQEIRNVWNVNEIVERKSSLYFKVKYIEENIVFSYMLSKFYGIVQTQTVSPSDFCSDYGLKIRWQHQNRKSNERSFTITSTTGNITGE